MATDLYKQYQESAVTQAQPVKLVELMLEGALRFTRLAQKAVADKDPEAAHNGILRAYAIVAELMATLDFESGGEIAVQLEQCYEYILHLLKEADIKKDGAILEQVVEMLEPLAQTWREAFAGGPATVPHQSEAIAGGDAETAGQPPDGQEAAETPPAARKKLDLIG